MSEGATEQTLKCQTGTDPVWRTPPRCPYLVARLRITCVCVSLALYLRYANRVKSPFASRKNHPRVRSFALPDIFARVYSKRGARALARVSAIFGLNKTEAGRLFGISRQAIDEWYGKGVPMGRLADVCRTADLAEALKNQFKPERIPQIVRSPLPGLGHHSILRFISERGTVPVFDMLDRAFSYIPRS